LFFISHFDKNFWTHGNSSFDESSWRLVIVSERTVAERGAETVNRFINGDVKATFTFFALVVADGTKVLLILVAKGKTPPSQTIRQPPGMSAGNLAQSKWLVY
jgi:hypothetical protein